MLWAPPTTALLLFEREEKGRDFAEQSPAYLSKKGFGSVKGGAMFSKKSRRIGSARRFRSFFATDGGILS
jgi:hypothetical protein